MNRIRENHELKTLPEYFEAVISGFKMFEVRKNDRDFRPHDGLWLREWDAEEGMYTGRWVECHIEYILYGGEFGIDPEYCVMGMVWVRQNEEYSKEWEDFCSKWVGLPATAPAAEEESS